MCSLVFGVISGLLEKKKTLLIIFRLGFQAKNISRKPVTNGTHDMVIWLVTLHR